MPSPAEAKIILERQAAENLGSGTLYQPGFVNTPLDLREAAQQTDQFIANIQAGLANAKKVPVAWLKAWTQFYAGWQRFYASNFSSVLKTTAKWATSDLQTQLVSYQQQAGAWAEQADKIRGVSIPGSRPQKEAGDAKKVLMWVGIGVVGIAVLAVAAKLLHSVVTGRLGCSDALIDAEDAALAIVAAKKRKKSSKSVYSIA
jgi:hypothetical protein